NALVYRLDYQSAPRPIAYALSEWEAPPGEMLTMRLRGLIKETNGGFTLSRLSNEKDGYQLEVSLERFLQVFSRPSESNCFVTMTATLIGPGGRLLSQRTFNAARPAPSANATGGVHGLVQASNAELEEIVKWVVATLQPTQALGLAGEDPRRRQ